MLSLILLRSSLATLDVVGIWIVVPSGGEQTVGAVEGGGVVIIVDDEEEESEFDKGGVVVGVIVVVEEEEDGKVGRKGEGGGGSIDIVKAERSASAAVWERSEALIWEYAVFTPSDGLATLFPDDGLSGFSCFSGEKILVPVVTTVSGGSCADEDKEDGGKEVDDKEADGCCDEFCSNGNGISE